MPVPKVKTKINKLEQFYQRENQSQPLTEGELANWLMQDEDVADYILRKYQERLTTLTDSSDILRIVDFWLQLFEKFPNLAQKYERIGFIFKTSEKTQRLCLWQLIEKCDAHQTDYFTRLVLVCPNVIRHMTIFDSRCSEKNGWEILQRKPAETDVSYRHRINQFFSKVDTITCDEFLERIQAKLKTDPNMQQLLARLSQEIPTLASYVIIHYEDMFKDHITSLGKQIEQVEQQLAKDSKDPLARCAYAHLHLQPCFSRFIDAQNPLVALIVLEKCPYIYAKSPVSTSLQQLINSAVQANNQHLIVAAHQHGLYQPGDNLNSQIFLLEAYLAVAIQTKDYQLFKQAETMFDALIANTRIAKPEETLSKLYFYRANGFASMIHDIASMTDMCLDYAKHYLSSDTTTAARLLQHALYQLHQLSQAPVDPKESAAVQQRANWQQLQQQGYQFAYNLALKLASENKHDQAHYWLSLIPSNHSCYQQAQATLSFAGKSAHPDASKGIQPITGELLSISQLAALKLPHYQKANRYNSQQACDVCFQLANEMKNNQRDNTPPPRLSATSQFWLPPALAAEIDVERSKQAHMPEPPKPSGDGSCAMM